MHPEDNEAMEAAPKRSGLDAWEVSVVLNLAEDIKASKFDGWTFSHFCNDGKRLGIAIQHRSGVYAVVHDQRDLAIKVREFDMVDAYIKTQLAALMQAAQQKVPLATAATPALIPNDPGATAASNVGF